MAAVSGAGAEGAPADSGVKALDSSEFLLMLIIMSDGKIAKAAYRVKRR